MRPLAALLLFLQLAIPSAAQHKPYIYWWWHGNAVDTAGLRYNLDEYARAGLGGVHIIPIYGKRGEAGIPLLSPQFNEMVRHTVRMAKARGLWVDMSLGSGWPYGGPDIPEDYRAQQLVPMVSKAGWPRHTWETVAYYASSDSINWKSIQPADTAAPARYKMVMVARPTYQKVKRAGPGGQGYVIDHFNPAALGHYLARFDSLVTGSGLRAVYMDSYEVFKANYSPSLIDAFQQRFGYDPRPWLPCLYYKNESVGAVRFRQDFAALLSDRLLAFGKELGHWAEQHNVLLRLQAHGAPTNIIDLYDQATVPETESFGTRADAIKGYVPDPDYPAQSFGYPDYYCMKLASTRRHEDPNALVSSETGTWNTEHFRDDPASLKIRIDELFLAGINQIGYHGAAYQSINDSFPGRRFYAAVHVGPNGHLLAKMPALNEYVGRCQQFLQNKTIKAEALILFDPADQWAQPVPPDRLVHMQETHFSHQWMHKTQQLARVLRERGIPFRFVSPAQLQKLAKEEGLKKYKALLIPDYDYLDRRVIQLLKGSSLGSLLIYKERPQARPMGSGTDLPDHVQLGLRVSADLEAVLNPCYRPQVHGRGLEVLALQDSSGQLSYFVNNRGQSDTVFYLKLIEPTFFIINPLEPGPGHRLATAPGAMGKDGWYMFYIPSGGTRLIKFDAYPVKGRPEPLPKYNKSIKFTGPWRVGLTEPNLKPPLRGNSLAPANDLLPPDRPVYIYENQFTSAQGGDILLDLGRVEQTATVYLNGANCGMVWALPKTLMLRNVPPGLNTLRLEVRPNDWNRIISFERRHPNWAQFDDINFVNINYKPFRVADQPYRPVGLLGPVRLWQQ